MQIRALRTATVAAALAAAMIFGWVLGTSASGQEFTKGNQIDSLVLSGSDIGFFPMTQNSDVATGQLMVRVSGRWVKAKLSDTMPGVRPLTH